MLIDKFLNKNITLMLSEYISSNLKKDKHKEYKMKKVDPKLYGLHSRIILRKNKKGIYIHFKLKGVGKTISELEKNEKIDKNLLRYLTVKVKKLDLKTNYFEKNLDEKKETVKKYEKN